MVTKSRFALCEGVGGGENWVFMALFKENLVVKGRKENNDWGQYRVNGRGKILLLSLPEEVEHTLLVTCPINIYSLLFVTASSLFRMATWLVKRRPHVLSPVGNPWDIWSCMGFLVKLLRNKTDDWAEAAVCPCAFFLFFLRPFPSLPPAFSLQQGSWIVRQAEGSQCYRWMLEKKEWRKLAPFWYQQATRSALGQSTTRDLYMKENLYSITATATSGETQLLPGNAVSHSKLSMIHTSTIPAHLTEKK